MVQQKIANMLSETVYTGITNLYIIMKNQQKHKAIHNKCYQCFLKSRVFNFFLKVSTLLQPQSSSVNMTMTMK